VTGAIVAALMVLRKQGKSRMAVIEPYYTYHSRQVEEVFQKLPEGIPSHPDWSPDFDGVCSHSCVSCVVSCRVCRALRPAVLTYTAAAIEKALKGGVEGIIIANPNNPTGRVWAKEELQKLYVVLSSPGT